MISTMEDGECRRIHTQSRLNCLINKQNATVSDIPFGEEVILHTEADLHGHEEITESVGLNNIYEVALENEIYLEQGPSINKYG